MFFLSLHFSSERCRDIFISLSQKSKTIARPHPPPAPSCGRYKSRGKAKNPFPQKKDFRFAESALKPHALPEYLEGRTPKRKMSFPFLEKIGRAQIRKARNI